MRFDLYSPNHRDLFQAPVVNSRVVETLACDDVIAVRMPIDARYFRTGRQLIGAVRAPFTILVLQRLGFRAVVAVEDVDGGPVTIVGRMRERHEFRGRRPRHVEAGGC